MATKLSEQVPSIGQFMSWSEAKQTAWLNSVDDECCDILIEAGRNPDEIRSRGMKQAKKNNKKNR